MSTGIKISNVTITDVADCGAGERFDTWVHSLKSLEQNVHEVSAERYDQIGKLAIGDQVRELLDDAFCVAHGLILEETADVVCKVKLN